MSRGKLIAIAAMAAPPLALLGYAIYKDPLVTSVSTAAFVWIVALMTAPVWWDEL